MNRTDGDLAGRVAELRRSFDHSFTLPHRTESDPGESLLEIGIGREAFALRLSEISGLFSGRKITPLPSSVAAFMGVVSFRGNILSVYSLQAFFNQPAAEPPSWLVVAAMAPIALAFHRFDGHLQISRENILPRDNGAQAEGSPAGQHSPGHLSGQYSTGSYVRDYARVQPTARPIVHLPAIIGAIRALSQKSSQRGSDEHV